MTLEHCPTHATCPNCREGCGHWDPDTQDYRPTIESEAVRAIAPNAVWLPLRSH